MQDKLIEILVVEDDDMLRKVMLLQLRLAGIQARSSSTGEHALELIEESVPSLIILDVGLPNMSGFDFVERLRLKPATENLPLIVHTSQELSAVDRERMVLGPTKIVTKATAFSDELPKLIHELTGAVSK